MTVREGRGLIVKHGHFCLAVLYHLLEGKPTPLAEAHSTGPQSRSSSSLEAVPPAPAKPAEAFRPSLHPISTSYVTLTPNCQPSCF